MSSAKDNIVWILDRRQGGSVISDKPQVSVVVPAYRSARYISETLDAALSQDGVMFEIIVVNDGSPDTEELEAVLTSYFDRIVYLRTENHGAGAARNIGIENARGKWIAFLDADDIWIKGYLASQIDHVENNELDMTYCDAVVFSENGDHPLSFMDTAPSKGAVTPRALLNGDCNVITSGTVVRRSSLLSVGMFEWERAMAEDFHLWMRLAASEARIGYRHDRLLRYRIHPESLSGDAVDRVKRSIGVFERVRETIRLDQADLDLIDERLISFDADLAVEQGKISLINGDDAEAAAHFSRAVELRGSLKLRVAAFLASNAPGVLRWSQSRR